MASTDYRRPRTVDEAIALLQADDSVVLAGGTDLVTLRASGAVAGRVLVDVKHIPELRGVARDHGVLRIGATATMREVATLGDGRPDALADGARLVGAPQTRNRATLGGNVCRSSPAGDTLPPLLALGARARLVGPDGERTMPLERFFTGPGRNLRRHGELMAALEVPLEESASAYCRYTYRAWMDLAVIGVAVGLRLVNGHCERAAVAFGGAAPTPVLVPEAGHALEGTRCDADSVDAAARAVEAAATPIDDARGTREHRLRALGVLTRRVIGIARERAEAAA